MQNTEAREVVAGASGGRSGIVNMERKKLIKLANVIYAASPVSTSGTFDGGGANVRAQVGRPTVTNTTSMTMA